MMQKLGFGGAEGRDGEDRSQGSRKGGEAVSADGSALIVACCREANAMACEG
ncbi:MAG: hypothetical protein AAGD01_03500 [Acidobacteriota bacterium]